MHRPPPGGTCHFGRPGTAVVHVTAANLRRVHRRPTTARFLTPRLRFSHNRICKQHRGSIPATRRAKRERLVPRAQRPPPPAPPAARRAAAASHGPGARPRAAATSSPASRRRSGPRSASVKCCVHHLPGEHQVAVDGRLAGARSAGRQAVGDRQHDDLDLATARWRAGSGRSAAARAACGAPGSPAAGAGAPGATTVSRSRVEVWRRRIRSSAISAPSRSWPMNVTRPLRGDAARGGLGHVVQQRPEHQAAAARSSSSARGSASTARTRSARPSGRRGSGSAASATACSHHLERVARARPGGGTRSAPGRGASSSWGTSAPSTPDLVEPGEGAGRERGSETMRPSSSARRSAGACPRRGGVAPARGRRGPGIHREPELDGQAGQRAAGAPGRRAARRRLDQAQAAARPGRRARRGGRSPRPRRPRGSGQGVDRQVAARQVLGDRRRPGAG